MSLLLLLSGTSASAPVQASFDPLTLAHQRILTTGVEKTITVNAPNDSSVELWVDGSKLGDMVSAGSGIFNYDWTAGSVNYSGVLVKAVGNISGDSETLTVTIAEANKVNTTMTSWSKSSGITITGSQPFWDGTTTAYRVQNSTTKSAANSWIAASWTAGTDVDCAFEMWIAPDEVKVFSPNLTSTGGYIDLSAANLGQSAGTKQMYPIVETRYDDATGLTWYRIQTQRSGAVSAPNNIFFYLRNAITDATYDGAIGDGFYIAFPRTADGQLPLTETQKLNIFKHSESAGVQVWRAQHRWASTTAVYNNAYFEVRVIVPTGWTSSGSYKSLYALGALPRSLEVGGGAGNAMIDEVVIAADTHNTENCVVIIPEFTSYSGLWYGAKENGTYNLGDYVGLIMTYFATQYLACADSREARALYSYSKGGCGVYSLMHQHQDKFGYACAVDANWQTVPLDWAAESVGYSAVEAYTTEANALTYDFYTLIASDAAAFQDKTRLVLRGYHTFQADLATMAARLDAYSVPYSYSSQAATEHAFEMDDEFEDGVAVMTTLGWSAA